MMSGGLHAGRVLYSQPRPPRVARAHVQVSAKGAGACRRKHVLTTRAVTFARLLTGSNE